MFTGIIEEIGTVKHIRRGRNSAVLTIQAKTVLENTKTGDSISVNGICLTVTSMFQNSFTADVMHETLNRSSLSCLTAGRHVNLERAMPANGRFGGHIVSGHADGVGKIVNLRKDDNAVWFTISADKNIIRYIAEKSSVAIDGISLTAVNSTQTDFSVSVIPHTMSETVLKELKEGDFVNIETDVISKYIERLVCFEYEQKNTNKITKELLYRYGF